MLNKKALKSMKIDKNEVEKVFLVPISFFQNTKAKVYTLKNQIMPYEIDENGEKIEYFPTKTLRLPKIYHKPWGSKEHKVWVYKYKGEVIWGITSILVLEFIKYLNSKN